MTTTQYVALCGALVAGCSAHLGPAPSPLNQPRSTQPVVVLLSIDGLMPAQVLDTEAKGSHLPNLRRMCEEGSFATGVRTVVPSLTYPAHTTMLTGVAPQIHGILANMPFDPLGTNQDGWYWYADDIRVPTLFDLAHREKLRVANVCWPVSVNAPVDFNYVQFWRASLPDDEKLYRGLSTPGLLDELQQHVGPIPYGNDFSLEADDQRTKFAAHLIEHEQPNFLTVYLGSLDAVQHRTGTNSSIARQYLEHLDSNVGRLQAALERNAPRNSVLAVVSDHGFVDYHTEIEIGSFLREEALIHINDTGHVTSWDAFAWPAGGSGAIILRHPDDPALRAAVEGVLALLEADSSYGVARIYRYGEVANLRGFSNASFVVSMKPGFKLGRNLVGPVIVRASGGTHGYLPDVVGMDAAFFVQGKGITHGHSFGRIDMRDVAPTLASLLSLRHVHAEGRNLLD